MSEFSCLDSAKCKLSVYIKNYTAQILDLFESIFLLFWVNENVEKCKLMIFILLRDCFANKLFFVCFKLENVNIFKNTESFHSGCHILLSQLIKNASLF